MAYNFLRKLTLNESIPNKELELTPLPYAKSDLDPAISDDALFYHYNKLAQGYVDRYNRDEGDADFNEAGAFLHNALFAQYQRLSPSNEPHGSALEFINKHFKNFENFKKEFEKVAMGVQGSGWVYLAKDGTVKTITNHAIRQDIVLLVDWWEHAWALDYKWDKKKYLANQWKIINWNVISSKVGLAS